MNVFKNRGRIAEAVDSAHSDVTSAADSVRQSAETLEIVGTIALTLLAIACAIATVKMLGSD